MCPRWQLFFATLSERSKTFSQQRFLDCHESATKLALPKQVPAPRSNAKKKDDDDDNYNDDTPNPGTPQDFSAFYVWAFIFCIREDNLDGTYTWELFL